MNRSRNRQRARFDSLGTSSIMVLFLDVAKACNEQRAVGRDPSPRTRLVGRGRRRALRTRGKAQQNIETFVLRRNSLEAARTVKIARQRSPRFSPKAPWRAPGPPHKV